MQTNCLYCGTEFYVKPSRFKKGWGKFCSIPCSNSFTKTIDQIPNVTCSYCNVEFYKKPSSLINSKSGLYFCCRQHKDYAQRIGGIVDIQPEHYKNGEGSYRKLALRLLPNECVKCGYKKIVEILQVHHKDKDRSNNKIGNLEIICPTCHHEFHFLDHSASWRNYKAG